MRTAEQDGGRNLREIAAELRVAAELFEVRPEDEALGRIPRAETEDRTPQVLREIAGRLESGNWWSSEDVPLGTAELLLRFPRFSQILPIYWGQDGMAISDDMQGSTEEQMEAFFCEEMGGGSGGEDFLGFFPLLARHCVDHLKEAHSPLWTPSR
ncbi:hypothetical protein OG586_11860 [Streptomyces murinus]|uniref:hypothetical protein n=1 Tax=Streptomyces murinus TaxID=33900 RepID=UPI002E81B6BF|nr:hypothetical protein [Streptomyces murinus]WUD06892.1 hypothetical protein OG586_11860 [Streptomyces murinus]